MVLLTPRQALEWAGIFLVVLLGLVALYTLMHPTWFGSEVPAPMPTEMAWGVIFAILTIAGVPLGATMLSRKGKE